MKHLGKFESTQQRDRMTLLLLILLASSFLQRTDAHSISMTSNPVDAELQLQIQLCRRQGFSALPQSSTHQLPACDPVNSLLHPSGGLEMTQDELLDSFSLWLEQSMRNSGCTNGNLGNCIKRSFSERRQLEEEELSTYTIYFNVVMSLICVCVAALAAGLTMGMLSIEPLSLMIKLRCGTATEISQAQAILPLIQQRHLLMVTLLLLNSISNEALPLFLDQLVPGYVAVLMSVTLVLIFGEIVPSAVFTGPDQISMAATMSPLVKFAKILLMPLAWPIAKLLDRFLGHDESVANSYGRMEISAMVRIMYEEQKREKQHLLRRTLALVEAKNSKIDPSSKSFMKLPSFHVDEVKMIEGAMQMRVKKAKDILTPLSKVSAIEKNAILDEDTITRIYSWGHSRIPVYQQMFDSTGNIVHDDISSITAVLLTRNLIVVDSYDKRPLSTLPLLIPICVDPDMSLVDLLNVFQEGGNSNSWRATHLAVVCRNPDMANNCLMEGFPIPKEAEVLGIVTMENVIEELIRENIHDEYDRDEAVDERRARHVYKKWKKFVEKRRLEKESSQGDATQLATVLEDTERTPLFKKLAIDWGGMLGH